MAENLLEQVRLQGMEQDEGGQGKCGTEEGWVEWGGNWGGEAAVHAQSCPLPGPDLPSWVNVLELQV